MAIFAKEYGVQIGRLRRKCQAVSREEVSNKKGKPCRGDSFLVKNHPVSCKVTLNCHPDLRFTN